MKGPSPPLVVVGLVAASFAWMAWVHAHRMKKPQWAVIYYSSDAHASMCWDGWKVAPPNGSAAKPFTCPRGLYYLKGMNLDDGMKP